MNELITIECPRCAAEQEELFEYIRKHDKLRGREPRQLVAVRYSRMPPGSCWHTRSTVMSEPKKLESEQEVVVKPQRPWWKRLFKRSGN